MPDVKTEVQKKQELVNWAIQQSYQLNNEEEVNHFISNIAVTCPVTAIAEFNLSTDVDKAYYVMQSKTADSQQKSTSPESNVPSIPGGNGVPGTRPQSQFTQEQRDEMRDMLVDWDNQNKEARKGVVISKLIVNKPKLEDRLGSKDIEAEINIDSWNNFVKKVDAGDFTIDPDSVARYNDWKTKAANSTPAAPFKLKVHMTDLNKRPIAYEITNNNTGTKTLRTREQLAADLIQTYVYINSTAQTAGVTLSYIKPRANKVDPSKSTESRVVIKDKDKNTAFDNGAYDIAFASTDKIAAEPLKVRSEDTIKYTSKTRKKQGTNELMQLTFRMPLKISGVKELERKAIYADVVSSGSKSFTEPPVGKDKQKIDEARINALLQISCGTVSEGTIDMTSMNAGFKQMLKNIKDKFNKKDQDAAAAMDGGF